MDLMQIPDSVVINTPDESMLGSFDAAWIWMVIIGIILIWQIVKFFFEIGERYVVLAVLTFMAPLAFGMGGSKNTEDIFKGWTRMYGSMCVMMLMNVVFLKLLLSAMSSVPSGFGLIPWFIFVVAIARVGRKVDDLVCRVGLNPARTGDPLGRGVPVMVSMMVAKGIGKMLASTASANKPGGKPSGGAGVSGSGSPRPGPVGPSGSPGGAGGTGSQRNATGSTYSANRSSTATQQTAAGAAMGGTAAAAGQAAQSATNAAGQSIGHAVTGQSPSAHRQPSGQTHPQESHTQSRTQAGQPLGGQPGQGAQSGQSSRPARTRPVNIDVEYKVNDRKAGREGTLGGDEPQPHTGTSAIPPHGGSPNLSTSGAQTKAAEIKPTRPPVSQTPRGNFPQAPVGAGAIPHMSHSTQQPSSTATDSHSQTTHTAGSTARPMPSRSAAPGGGATVQGATVTNNSTPQTPSQQPLHGARSTGVGIDRGAAPTGTTRPPIGHNAVAKPVSQESPATSSGRNSTSQSAPPSLGSFWLQTRLVTARANRHGTPKSCSTKRGKMPQRAGRFGLYRVSF